MEEDGGDEQGDERKATEEVDDEKPRQAHHVDISRACAREVVKRLSVQPSVVGKGIVTYSVSE